MTRSFFSTPASVFSKLALVGIAMLLPMACGGSNDNNPVAVKPAITTQPADQSVNDGQPATFSVVATGTATLKYQWSKGTASISGATAATYTTPAVTMADDGSTFTVTVTNSVGNVTSSAATLTVNAAPIAISTQPIGKVIYEGQSMTFTVAATGTSPQYHWKKDGTAITDAASATYTIASPVTADSGVYTVDVSNDASSVTSDDAKLTVQTLPARAVAMPLISLNAPAYASSGTPANAVDATGDTLWDIGATPSAGAPQYIAVDLSAHPTSKIMLQWSNYYTWNYQTGVMAYDTRSYNLVSDYTIEGNTAAGGGSAAPTSGWTVLETGTTNNTYHSRQHLLDFTGYNWVRLSVTKDNDSNNPSLNLEVHDASATSADDSWLILGDSITAFAMGQKETEEIDIRDSSWNLIEAGPVLPLGRSFPELIALGNDANSPNPHFDGATGFFPSSENGGVGGIKASDVALGSTRAELSTSDVLIDRWLAETQATYIGIAYGTNDVNGADSSTIPSVAANLEIICNKITAAGKKPVLAKLIWSLEPTIQANGPLLNAAIDALYVAHPEIIHGPDLWTAFVGHTEYFRYTYDNTAQQKIQDTLHPNQDGERVMREEWAKAMLATIYRP